MQTDTQKTDGPATLRCGDGFGPSWNEVAASFPNTVEPRRVHGGIAFHWSRKGVGFGVLTLRCTNGVLDVDEECMSDDFCMDVLKQAFTEAIANRPNHGLG